MNNIYHTINLVLRSGGLFCWTPGYSLNSAISVQVLGEEQQGRAA